MHGNRRRGPADDALCDRLSCGGEVAELFEDPLVVVLPTGAAALASSDEVLWPDLADEAFIVEPRALADPSHAVAMRAVSEDLQALRELERVALGLPEGLQLEWLGVAGYRITYENVSIPVDP